jgi:hypothetical protein
MPPDKRNGPHASTGRRQPPQTTTARVTGELAARDAPVLLRRDPPALFGQPSSYSLSPAELAAHIRRLRQSGWQGWEVRQRFDFRGAA